MIIPVFIALANLFFSSPLDMLQLFQLAVYWLATNTPKQQRTLLRITSNCSVFRSNSIIQRQQTMLPPAVRCHACHRLKRGLLMRYQNLLFMGLHQ